MTRGLVFANHVPTIIGFTVSGCCSNVITFEKLARYNPEITTLITFSQYLFIFVCLSLYLRLTRYWSKKGEADAGFGFGFQFLVPVLSQVVTGYLGNRVFQYNLSMPTHIIFRSSGTAMTLLLGWVFWGKRYGADKIIGSVLIALGTVVFTLDVKHVAVAAESVAGDESQRTTTQTIGMAILLLTTVISSMTSLLKEDWYQNGGTKLEWKEVLYYDYLYGLGLYIVLLPQVYSELGTLRLAMAATATATGVGEASGLSQTGETAVTFFVNWITQLCCILGVNALVFRVSALSLTIVLLVRRFLSLMLSIYLFDNQVSPAGYVGVLCVFLGAVVYSFGGKKLEKPQVGKKK